MEHLTTKQELGTTPPELALREKFREIFPSALRDGVLDVESIATLLGVEIAQFREGKESFGLSWAGKAQAAQAAQAPSFAALRPDFDASINWDNAKNVFIEGDNLEVLKLLQSAYNDKIKMIYIDPPYNTGNDFVYNDDFSDSKKRYLEVTGQVDSDGNRLSTNTETSGRKHSNWLSMMYPRLWLARNLLTQDGSIFVSIDDNELHNLRHLMDDIFGPENFVSILNWKKRSTGGQVANNALIDQVEYIVVYARSLNDLSLRGVKNENAGKSKWRSFRKAGGDWQRRHRPNQFFPIYSAADGRVSLEPFDGAEPVYPANREGIEGFWENGTETARQRIERGELRGRLINGKLSIEQLETSGETSNAGNFIEVPSVRGTNEVRNVFGEVVFDNAKPVDLLDFCLQISGAAPGDTVADFFAGSGSFAEAVLRRGSEGEEKMNLVLVNLKEETAPSSQARQAGFEFVSDITLARVRNALEAEPESTRGIRVFRLGPSSFEPFFPEESGLFNLQETSKSQNFEIDAAAAEVLLKQGVGLDEQWFRELGVRSGSVLFVDGDDVARVEASNLPESISTVVVPEDAFIGRDDLKAKLHFDLKQVNKKLVTY